MMSYNLQIEQYRKNTALNASPMQLIIQLYDGAIKFVNQGRKAMLEKNFYEQNQNLQKAQNIIMELIFALDYENGKELADNLFKIYTSLQYNIAEANTENDPKKLDKIKTILSQLRSSWSQLAA